MALFNCPECGREISDTAKQCPHCGYTLKSDIETAKQVASVAGNALRNVFFKYGEAVIPMLFLLAGTLYLIIGFFGGAYYDFYINKWDNNKLYTPFDETVAFWLPLLGTIILPIVSLIICRNVRKKAEAKDSAPIQLPKFSKRIVLWMVLIYVVGFSILSTVFYFDYTNAKRELTMVATEGLSSETSDATNTITSDIGTYSFTMESGVDKENYKVVLNDDMTAQLIYESGNVVYGSWNRTSVGPNPEFIIRTPTLKNPYSKGRLSLYFRDGYVYFSYDQVRAKDPTNRTPYTKTN